MSADRYASLHIPCPLVPEQKAIVDFLERETEKIDGMVAQVETAIERLQVYRTALITAAISGKIDVRGTADAKPGALASVVSADRRDIPNTV